MPSSEPIPLKSTAGYKKLRLAWLLAALASVAALVFTFPLADRWWQGPYTIRWQFLTAAAMGYFIFIFWKNLPANHRPGESQLLPGLGWGNSLTFLRSIPMAMVVGFLFSPRPDGIYAWLPGVLYTLASLPDFVDGYMARKTNHVTELGAALDMNVDSVGVFAATTLAFLYGVVPWWYLPIGLARYLFVAGIRLREIRKLPVYELPFSHRRRGFAALKMGFMFVMLFPLFGPPGTHLAAFAFGLPFAIGFLWDWGLATGRLNPEGYPWMDAIQAWLLRRLPLLLRALALLLVWPQIWRHIQTPGLVSLAAWEIGVTALLVLGIAPRTTAIVAVCLMGVNQNIIPLDFAQSLLVFVHIGLIFVGSGPVSLWPFEERLVYNRMGDGPDA